MHRHVIPFSCSWLHLREDEAAAGRCVLQTPACGDADADDSCFMFQLPTTAFPSPHDDETGDELEEVRGYAQRAIR